MPHDEDRVRNIPSITNLVVDGPKCSATKATIIGQAHFHPKSLVIVKAYPLIIPRDLFDAGGTIHPRWGKFLLQYDPVDFAEAENTLEIRTRSGFAWTSERTVRTHAICISNSVATAIISNSKIEFLWSEAEAPQRWQGVVDFLQIRVRFDLRT